MELMACKCVFMVRRRGHQAASVWLDAQHKILQSTTVDKTDTLKVMQVYADRWGIMLPEYLQPAGILEKKV